MWKWGGEGEVNPSPDSHILVPTGILQLDPTCDLQFIPDSKLTEWCEWDTEVKKDALGEYCVTLVPLEMGCLKKGQQIGQIIIIPKCLRVHGKMYSAQLGTKVWVAPSVAERGRAKGRKGEIVAWGPGSTALVLIELEDQPIYVPIHRLLPLP